MPIDEIERERLRACFRTHMDAENRHDLEGVMATFADKTEMLYNRLSFRKDPAIRLAHVALGMSPSGGAIEGLTGIVDVEHFTDDEMVIEGRMCGKHVAEFAGFAPTGGDVELPYVAFYRFDAAGLLTSERIVMNLGPLSGTDVAYRQPRDARGREGEYRGGITSRRRESPGMARRPSPSARAREGADTPARRDQRGAAAAPLGAGDTGLPLRRRGGRGFAGRPLWRAEPAARLSLHVRPFLGEGCPSCSFWADSFNGAGVHLAHRDVSFAAVSRAPYAKLAAYERRMGWSFPWYSSANSDFNYDFNVSFTAEDVQAGEGTYNFAARVLPMQEQQGLSAFAKEDGVIYHTYSTYARGIDAFNATYQLLDMAPRGRDEDGLPWSMAWLRRHDQYDE